MRINLNPGLPFRRTRGAAKGAYRAARSGARSARPHAAAGFHRLPSGVQSSMKSHPYRWGAGAAGVGAMAFYNPSPAGPYRNRRRSSTTGTSTGAMGAPMPRASGGYA